MADHYAVTKHLRGLSTEDLIELGEALGLYYPHLRKMNHLLKDMVASWLNREDNVQSASGDPSWGSLIKTLRVIDQPGIADKIAKGVELDYIDKLCKYLTVMVHLFLQLVSTFTDCGNSKD